MLGRGDEGGAATAAAADRQLHPCSCVSPPPQTGPVAPLLLRRAAAADRGRRGQRLGEGALELTHARAMLRASAPERAPQLSHGASASPRQRVRAREWSPAGLSQGPPELAHGASGASPRQRVELEHGAKREESRGERWREKLRS